MKITFLHGSKKQRSLSNLTAWAPNIWLLAVGYFTKIDPTITHLANLNEHLVNQLMLIDIDVDTVLKLAPYLKMAQIKAMSNGNDFVMILLPFELYKTWLTHGHDSSQTTTKVVGVKGAPKDAKLLRYAHGI